MSNISNLSTSDSQEKLLCIPLKMEVGGGGVYVNNVVTTRGWV